VSTTMIYNEVKDENPATEAGFQEAVSLAGFGAQRCAYEGRGRRAAVIRDSPRIL